MKKIVFSLLLVNVIAFGQIEKKPGDFHKVTSFDRIDVLLIPGNEDIVQLDGKNAEDVEVVNKNGELKIRMPLTKLLDGDTVSVTVYYKDIDAVEANEGSRIACNDRIETSSFDIIAKEGSEIKLNLDVKKLNVKVKNGSKVSLDGEAQNQDSVVSTGGIYYARGLETNQSTIVVNAGGLAQIYATDLVNATVRAGGNISIYGDPKQINKDVVVGGNIEIVKKK